MGSVHEPLGARLRCWENTGGCPKEPDCALYTKGSVLLGSFAECVTGEGQRLFVQLLGS